MKTRIIHTRVWQDGWLRALDAEVKVYYLYLLTNEYVNIAHFQEVPLSTESIETGLSIETVQKAKKILTKDKKIVWYRDYLYLCNAFKYAHYSGIKNDHLKLRIIFEMSDETIKHLEQPVLKTLLDVMSDIQSTTDSSMLIKVNNLMRRLQDRLDILGIVYPSDRGIGIEGKNQKPEIKDYKSKTINQKSEIDKFKSKFGRA